ncbi:MAG: hypothetical protein LBT94_09085 [Prevotellaceae bacterium]|jgi:hypothetical protein|nr:hypothetical protein [Prevotellaceae bacterium]
MKEIRQQMLSTAKVQIIPKSPKKICETLRILNVVYHRFALLRAEREPERNGEKDNPKETATFAASEQPLTVAQMLEGTTPIDAPKHRFKNFDEARRWARENIVGTYKNEHTGEDINVSKTAIDKYVSASAVLKSVNKDAHLSALGQIPKLIQTAILRERQQDRDNNQDIKEIQRLYGAISYEGAQYPVKITVKAYPTGSNKAYSYEVVKIENPIGQWEHSVESPPRLGNLPVEDVGDLVPKSADFSTDFSTSKGTNNS